MQIERDGDPLIALPSKIMNPQELLQSAPRLSQSNRAYIIFDNGERGIIVPPGARAALVSACRGVGRHAWLRQCRARCVS